MNCKFVHCNYGSNAQFNACQSSLRECVPLYIVFGHDKMVILQQTKNPICPSARSAKLVNVPLCVAYATGFTARVSYNAYAKTTQSLKPVSGDYLETLMAILMRCPVVVKWNAAKAAGWDALLVALYGTGIITIDGSESLLQAGDTIVMPAGVPHAVYAQERFKMLLTVLFPEKHGEEAKQ